MNRIARCLPLEAGAALSALLHAPLLALLLALLPPGSLQAAYRVPWQGFEPPAYCERENRDSGYFRPEYVELVQRLDSETIGWLDRNYPILGWGGMDPRLYTPKDIPGNRMETERFVYDPSRRRLELQALFHFGPPGGNGTLIAELLPLGPQRLVSVNVGSRNLSIIDTARPDILGAIPTRRGVAAFDVNLPAGELLLVEREAQGVLVHGLDDFAPRDTLFLEFHPGAVLLSPDTRYLYLTDEDRQSLAVIDLKGDGGPVGVPAGLTPPYLLAVEEESGSVLLVGREQGTVRAFAAGSLERLGARLELGGRVTAIQGGAAALYLATGGCEGSRLHRVSLDQGGLQQLELGPVEGQVRSLALDEPGGRLYALAGRELHLMALDGGGRRAGVRFSQLQRRVACDQGRVFVTGGMSDLQAFDPELERPAQRVRLELGPGPMVSREGRLFVANGLSNSINIFSNGKELKEELSILVGVLLGRMEFIDQRLVVNNCFRGNVMVLDPYSYRIEDIVPVGGAMDYRPLDRSFLFIDDSVVVGMPSPPSKLAIADRMEMSSGVRLWAPTGEEDFLLVADQDRYLFSVDLGSLFRRDVVPLSAQALGIFTFEDRAWVFAPDYLFQFATDRSLRLVSSYPVRGYRMSLPFVAVERSVRRGGGAELNLISNDRLVDVASTRSEVTVMRDDPDTNSTYIGTRETVYVYESNGRLKATIPLPAPAADLYLPLLGPRGYVATPEYLAIVDRQSLFRYDEVQVGGSFIYVAGDDLFLRRFDDPRRMAVADGYRGMLYEELELPLVPTDAASDGESLFLLGGAEGAVAIYVNMVDVSRLPRATDRQAWDHGADRRTGTHR